MFKAFSFFFMVSFKYFPTRVLTSISLFCNEFQCICWVPSHCDFFFLWLARRLQRQEFLFTGSIKKCLHQNTLVLIVVLVRDCCPSKLIVILQKGSLSSGLGSTVYSYSTHSIQCFGNKKIFFTKIRFFRKMLVCSKHFNTKVRSDPFKEKRSMG